MIIYNFVIFQPSKGNAEGMWQHDLYDGSGGGIKRQRQVPAGGLTSGSGKLHISNLDFGVSESDIQVSVLYLVSLNIIL